MSFDFVSIYFKNIGECHSILQYFLQIYYKSQCPLPSALLYLRVPSSVGKAGIFLLNAPCQVPYFTRGARPVHFDRQMYSFFFKVMPLATCARFSAATGCCLCRNEFLPGVLDNNKSRLNKLNNNNNKLKSIMIYLEIKSRYN